MHAAHLTQQLLITEDVPVMDKTLPFVNHYVIPMICVKDMSLDESKASFGR